MRHVHRHTFLATLPIELEYDPEDPSSYTDVLEQVAAKRKALLDLGCALAKDEGRPVRVKE